MEHLDVYSHLSLLKNIRVVHNIVVIFPNNSIVPI